MTQIYSKEANQVTVQNIGDIQKSIHQWLNFIGEAFRTYNLDSLNLITSCTIDETTGNLLHLVEVHYSGTNTREVDDRRKTLIQKYGVPYSYYNKRNVPVELEGTVFETLVGRILGLKKAMQAIADTHLPSISADHLGVISQIKGLNAFDATAFRHLEFKMPLQEFQAFGNAYPVAVLTNMHQLQTLKKFL